MHPLLHSWRDDLSAAFVRLLAYVGAAALLTMAALYLFQSPPPMSPIAPVHRSPWAEIERPFPAFALSIPEAVDAASSYAIRRHKDGGGRKDILTLGDADDAGPYLQVEIYRPGTEASGFASPAAEIVAAAADLGPTDTDASAEPLASKFGPLNIVAFEAHKGVDRRCLGFVRAYDDPLMQISGWFCQSGANVERSTLACALDRLTLLAAGSEPKVGALFAQAELKRSYCGQRDTILAPTPKYHLLWKALANRPEPRRIGQ